MSGNVGRGDLEDAAIVFDRVDKAFSGRKVLDKVSFSVARGETLCVTGTRRNRQECHSEANDRSAQSRRRQCHAGGADMATLDEDGLVKVRQKMGFLFQSAALFDSFSLYQNLALPLHRLDRTKSRDEIKHAVHEDLRQVGLDKDGEKMPAALSGGMQKRAGLARALILRPEILLVDEPSSGLDRSHCGRDRRPSSQGQERKSHHHGDCHP